MEWFEQIWNEITNYISVPYILTFMLLSYFMKRYFGDWLSRITTYRWKSVYTVLIMATVIAVPFAICSEYTWVQILFSYALGTSLHELVFSFIEDKFKK
jgi:hypothetical protein